MSETILKVENLHVQYKTDDGLIYALNGVNLQVPKGGTLGLVGETGAGKTTLAMSVMRLLPKNVGSITEGNIEFDGLDLATVKENHMCDYRGKRISIIFQDPMTSLNPVLPVGDQVGEVIAWHHRNMSKKEIAAEVDRMLELVGIPAERKYEYPHQFSGGMKQRVVIAIALACNPELLIADEPTTALDVTIQAQVLAMMADLKKRLGTSMIMITHDLGVVAETCDRVAVMYAGEVVENGSVEEIFEGEHHHPYTEGLFGSIPSMNGNERRLKPIEGLMLDPTKQIEGCRFAPRCPYATDRCRAEAPSDVIRNGHMIKCHRFGKEEV